MSESPKIVHHHKTKRMLRMKEGDLFFCVECRKVYVQDHQKGDWQFVGEVTADCLAPLSVVKFGLEEEGVYSNCQ